MPSPLFPRRHAYYNLLTLLLMVVVPSLALADATTFLQPLAVHPSPIMCPSVDKGGTDWVPDENYRICCQRNIGASFYATLTTARGPNGPIYACCQSQYTCTGTAPFVSDWAPGTHTGTFLPPTHPSQQ